ncbi:RidA family protein [Microvirga massiliensis]|uniref:RidA family protein n=1 Tax=Microvirga massiliensis TaxID=1033741 RepID=UPI00062B96A0|nr:RidA family protein [Microvirga massiliensis]
MKRFIGDPLPVPLTPAVQVGNMLFLSGQVPTRPDGSIPEGIGPQTQLVLEKLSALAEEAGFSLGDVVKTTVFLRDMKDFSGMNEVYGKFFPSNPPARSCVRAEVAIDADVEIEAIAIKGA